MSNTRAVKVGNTTYNAALASAEDGFELLKLVGAVVVMYKGKNQQLMIDTPLIASSLLCLSLGDLRRVQELVMGKIFVHGNSELVTIRDFQGRQGELIRLIAELVRFNLEDFFDWVAPAESAEEATTIKREK